MRYKLDGMPHGRGGLAQGAEVKLMMKESLEKVVGEGRSDSTRAGGRGEKDNQRAESPGCIHSACITTSAG